MNGTRLTMRSGGAGEAAPEAISLRDVSVVFPTPQGEPNRVVTDVSVTIAEGEIVCLLGPSGCGKSTLLNVIAGLLRPATGSISCFGEEVEGVNTRVGYITQSPNLLPWRSLADNVGIGLEIDGLSRHDAELRISRVVEMLGLRGYEKLYPRQLSGGMRSRAALARTLVTDRSILLMDEPFAALDAQRRAQLQSEVQKIWIADSKTIVFVTHDIDEALILGSRIIVFGPGPASQVVSEYETGLDYPRDVAVVRNDPGYGELWAQLWKDLGGGGDDRS